MNERISQRSVYMCKHPRSDSHLFSVHQQHWKYRFLLHLFFIPDTLGHNRVGGGQASESTSIIRGNIWRIQFAHICSQHISSRAAYHMTNVDIEWEVGGVGVMIQLEGAKVICCSFDPDTIAGVQSCDVAYLVMVLWADWSYHSNKTFIPKLSVATVRSSVCRHSVRSRDLSASQQSTQKKLSKTFIIFFSIIYSFVTKATSLRSHTPAMCSTKHKQRSTSL